MQQEDPSLPERVRATPTSVSILAGIRRSGEWEPPGELRVIHILGGAHLDFREALLLEGVTEVTIYSVLAGARIIVPPEVSVDASGVGVLGTFDQVSREAEDPEAPVLRIRGLCLLGSVHIREGTVGDTLKRGLRKLFG